MDPSNAQDNRPKPILIGICGGSGVGKNVISTKIKEKVEKKNLTCYVVDEKFFFKELPQDLRTQIEGKTQDEVNQIVLKTYDFDVPGAVNWELFEKVVTDITNGKDTKIHQYDSSKFQAGEEISVKRHDVYLITGRLILGNKRIRDQFDVSVFLETDIDLMLSRRVYKHNKHRDIGLVLDHYMNKVRPNYESYILPLKTYADFIVLNFGGFNYNLDSFSDNNEIYDLLENHIESELKPVY